MTTNQLSQARQTLETLRATAPSVTWHMTFNYYTKLPEFTAIKDGGVQFSMYKRERLEMVTQANGIKYPRYTGEKFVELSATYDYSTRDNGAMVVSGAHSFDALPRAEIKREIKRVSFKDYLQFINDNLGMLERIGA